MYCCFAVFLLAELHEILALVEVPLMHLWCSSTITALLRSLLLEIFCACKIPNYGRRYMFDDSLGLGLKLSRVYAYIYV